MSTTQVFQIPRSLPRSLSSDPARRRRQQLADPQFHVREGAVTRAQLVCEPTPRPLVRWRQFRGNCYDAVFEPVRCRRYETL